MTATDPVMGRRTLLAAGAGAAAAAAVPGAAAQSGDLEEHLSDVDGYDGVADHTDAEELTVAVGAGGGLQFDPPAVRVTPGTTVVWEWTGEGGRHNVADLDGAFESDLTDEPGHTFEVTFEEPGTNLYVCDPHAAAGMRGAIVVAPPDPTSAVDEYLADVDAYDGIADRRGEETVDVAVGAGNGLQFDPLAIRVDPGTTVRWEWTGEGGRHNVVEADGAFESDLTDEAGHTFEATLEERGAYRYACDPHESAGMKGAIVVGDGGLGGGGEGSIAGGGDLRLVGGVTAILLVPLAYLLVLMGRELSGEETGPTASQRRRT